MTEKVEKLTVMLIAFAVFMCGAFALWMEHGQTRTILLGGAVVVLLGIAARQTVKRLKKR